MKDITSYKKKYLDDGYFIVRKYLDNELVDCINKFLDLSKPKLAIPYSGNVPWGYGNLIQNNEFINFFPILDIKENITPYINKNLEVNHILAVNKAPFIGPDVEWHQEFFNINTFAPGYDPANDLNKFMQIFIGLDFHTKENGPLLVFEGSHKEGLLTSEDIVNSNLVHKRRLPFSELERISKIYKIKDVILEPGDAIFFNHLLVHGSGTNTSPSRRRALLLQVRSAMKEKKEKIFREEVEHRSKFLIRNFKNKIDKLTDENPYKDMK